MAPEAVLGHVRNRLFLDIGLPNIIGPNVQVLSIRPEDIWAN